MKGTPEPSQSPDLRIENVARVLLAIYENEYEADHLTWLDFVKDATNVLSAADAVDPLRAELITPSDPEHPDWCMRDTGCILPAGHDGGCDLRAALTSEDLFGEGVPAGKVGKRARAETAEAINDLVHQELADRDDTITDLREQIDGLRAKPAAVEALRDSGPQFDGTSSTPYYCGYENARRAWLKALHAALATGDPE